MLPLFKAHRIDDFGLVGDVLRSGYLGEGPMVERLASTLRGLFDDTPTILLNSGTSAIQLALTLAGVRPGDLVVSTPYTMVATNTAITAVGAKILWCDVDPLTFCMSIDCAQGCCRGDVKAIVLTCIGGLVPQRLEEFRSLGIPIILDCSHALATRYDGRHVVNWADFCCFSFQAVKHLTTGDGGALTVNLSNSVERCLGSSEEVFARAVRLKWFGLARQNLTVRPLNQMLDDIHEAGYKYQMNDVAAAIGLSCMPAAVAAIERSIDNADYYISGLGSVNEISLPVVGRCEPSWWVFGFLCDDSVGLMEHLRKAKIQASSLWRRNDEYTCFREYRGERLPGMDVIASRAVFIPVGWWVTDEMRELVVDRVSDFFGR